MAGLRESELVEVGQVVAATVIGQALIGDVKVVKTLDQNDDPSYIFFVEIDPVVSKTDTGLLTADMLLALRQALIDRGDETIPRLRLPERV